MERLSIDDDDDDGVADSCDTCPHVPGAQLDSDGDGVGDICDPSSAATEALVKFEPFLAFPEWEVSDTDQFTVANSALLAPTVNDSAWIGFLDDPANTEAVMRGTVDAIGPGAYQLSIQFGLVGDDGSEYCEVYRTPTPSLKITRGVPPDTFDTLTFMNLPAFAPGPFTMRYGHSSAGLRCELTMGGATYTISTPQSFSVPRDVITLQFIDVDVTVESFAQIDTSP